MLSGAEGKSAALPVPTPLYPKKNEKLRLAWAEEHIQFTTDELTWIILSEQTHINDSPVVAEFTTRKVRYVLLFICKNTEYYVLRHVGEGLENFYTAYQYRKRGSRMYWGSLMVVVQGLFFSGSLDGGK